MSEFVVEHAGLSCVRVAFCPPPPPPPPPPPFLSLSLPGLRWLAGGGEEGGGKAGSYLWAADTSCACQLLEQVAKTRAVCDTQ